MSARDNEVSIYSYMPTLRCCAFNGGVDCDEQDIPNKCKKCGWNPEEAKRRKIEVRTKFGELMREKNEGV